MDRVYAGRQMHAQDVQRESLTMRRIEGSAFAVLSGSALVFSAYEDNGEMWTGEGPRLASHTVRFDAPFLTPPIVHISINMWDMGANQNARADISADEITPDGFRIVFRTWGDTRVARVRAEWIAIGPVGYLDDFTDI